MAKPKHASSYSLSPDAKEMLDRLAETLGIPRSNVLELAIRHLAKKEGVGAAKKNSEKSSKHA